jgi:tetratricopeptide (TPR) repeat protein
MVDIISDPKSLSEKADGIYQEGDFESAARLYGEAASAFLALGSNLDAAEMKNNQSVAFLQAGNAQSALEAATGTAQVFFTGGDVRRQGIALANEATPLESLGRLDQAMEKYLQAAEAFKESGDAQLRASVMQAVAGIHLRRGKVFEALGDIRVGLAEVENPTFTQKIMKGLLRLRVW